MHVTSHLHSRIISIILCIASSKIPTKISIDRDNTSWRGRNFSRASRVDASAIFACAGSWNAAHRGLRQRDSHGPARVNQEILIEEKRSRILWRKARQIGGPSPWVENPQSAEWCFPFAHHVPNREFHRFYRPKIGETLWVNWSRVHDCFYGAFCIDIGPHIRSPTLMTHVFPLKSDAETRTIHDKTQIILDVLCVVI